LEQHATQQQIGRVLEVARQHGYLPRSWSEPGRIVVALLGSLGEESEEATFENLAGVNCVQQFETRYELSSRAYKSEDSRVSVGNIEIGGNRFIVAAGPCTVENKEGLSATAEGVVAAGASIIRGGAFKSRTSPFNFQGMGKSGLELLFQVSRHIGVPFVTEVVDPKGVDLISKYADMLQVGSRNMQNSALLTAIGRSGKPVLLKRGFANTIGEWLAAADYILAEGNNKVVLCERHAVFFGPVLRSGRKASKPSSHNG
jgi:3-deoxy-7-phosphoheptulonate synthase